MKKDVILTAFRDQAFVTLVEKRQHNGISYSCFINLNESEWNSFFAAIPAIGVLCYGYDVPDTLIPEKEPQTRGTEKSCNLCDGKMHAVTTHKDRMHKNTKLKEADLNEVQISNKTAYNQMAYLCEYCGTPIYLDCHCHKFDCKECEPSNFCDDCGDIIVYKSKFSDLHY